MSMKDDYPHKNFADLIPTYLSGELSAEEEVRFEEILANDPEKKVLLEEYRKLWDSVGLVQDHPEYDMDLEWKMLDNRLVPATGIKVVGRRSTLYFAYRIAAALVVGLLFTFAWIYGSRMIGSEVVTARTEPVEISLKDGTRVTLNRQSSLRYKKREGDAERKVYLTGEAYFDVARDTMRTFVIEAGAALVKVLGTSFNVNAYSENEHVKITVSSGIVALSGKLDQKDQIILKAGNDGTFNKESRRLKLVKQSDPNTVSWKTRELYFENTPLQDAVTLINKVYHTSLVIMNPELVSCPITVTFRDQSMDAVLNVLEMTLDITITREGDQILIEGQGCIE